MSNKNLRIDADRLLRRTLIVALAVMTQACSAATPTPAAPLPPQSPQEAAAARLAPTFFPAPEASGTQAVAVYCSGNGPAVVSFGMPFPRGFVTDSAQIRLENAAGAEVAADVSDLLRWRHLTDAQVDGRSLRSVLITFRHECSAGKPAAYAVHWGVARTLKANAGITPANVASTWILKAKPEADENPATDNYEHDSKAPPIKEPAAWVALPSDWLLKLVTRGPSLGVPDKKAQAQWLGFAKTFVNDVSKDVVAYQTDQAGGLIDWNAEVEGWLYDRPYTLWNAYFGTGDVRWFRHAHRASQYYQSWVAADDDSHSPQRRGAFFKKPPDYGRDPGDGKYSLAAGLMVDYMLTGDARLLQTIKNTADFTAEVTGTRLFPADRTHGLWTERQVGVALSNAVYAYEATGDKKYRDQARAIVDGFLQDVASPPSGYPDMHGVLLHRPEVHEGDSYSDWIMSPWMSALLGETLWHYYVYSNDSRALQLIGNYAQFIAEHSLYSDKTDAHLSEYWYPYYISGLKAGHTDNGPNDDKEHAYDVLGLLMRGRWARKALGQPTTAIDAQLDRLKKTAQFNFDDWIRDSPGLPRYRVAPTRKFGWWYGTTYDLAWFAQQN